MKTRLWANLGTFTFMNVDPFFCEIKKKKNPGDFSIWIIFVSPIQYIKNLHVVAAIPVRVG